MVDNKKGRNPGGAMGVRGGKTDLTKKVLIIITSTKPKPGLVLLDYKRSHKLLCLSTQGQVAVGREVWGKGAGERGGTCRMEDQQLL